MIRYSEIFYSIQGEGERTGHCTAWVRFFMCNLQCNGFGQDHPTRPRTWKLPYQMIRTDDFDRLEDLPVFDKGCDSSYSWATKFKHLQHQDTAEEIADKILDMLPHNSLNYGQSIDLCFTGGEPLLPVNQRAAMAIMKALRNKHNQPACLTFETNGTQRLLPEFIDFFQNAGLYTGKLFFSVSPKLFTVSGEKNVIKPDVVRDYFNLSGYGQLKFVIGVDDNQWDELSKAIYKFREGGVYYPIWTMPCGALDSQQNLIAEKVAIRSMSKGYHVAARVHTYLFGNKMGT